MPFLTLLLALFSSTLKAGEWETLFDGHSTDAFRAYQKDLFPSQAWNVIDGTLRTNPKATPVDLITKKHIKASNWSSIGSPPKEPTVA